MFSFSFHPILRAMKFEQMMNNNQGVCNVASLISASKQLLLRLVEFDTLSITRSKNAMIALAQSKGVKRCVRIQRAYYRISSLLVYETALGTRSPDRKQTYSKFSMCMPFLLFGIKLYSLFFSFFFSKCFGARPSSLAPTARKNGRGNNIMHCVSLS